MIISEKISYYNSKIETMSREEFSNFQWKKLKYQVEYLYHNNLFYQRKLKKAKITPDDIKTREDFFRKVPFTTKTELIEDQEEKPPYGLRLGVSERAITQMHLTSGTSGMGQEAYGLTRADVELLGSKGAPTLYWAGLRKGDVAVVTIPIGTNAGALMIVESLKKIGTNPMYLAIYDSKTKLQLMKRFKPQLIFTTPGYLNTLSLLLKEVGIEPRKDYPTLKAIFMAGEGYSIAWAQKMEQIWDTRLYEAYGSTQGGSIAAGTCERGAIPGGKRGSMHLIEWHYYIEVINPETGKPVDSGEEGEVIITPFDREASPLLRFRTADRVRYFSYRHCDCGRPLDIWEAGGIFRYDEMLKIKGVNIWPDTIDNVIFSRLEIDEYRGKVSVDNKGREQAVITLSFKPDTLLSAESKQKFMTKITEEIKVKTMVTMKVVETKEDISDRGKLKAKRWVDERQAKREETW